MTVVQFKVTLMNKIDFTIKHDFAIFSVLFKDMFLMENLYEVKIKPAECLNFIISPESCCGHSLMFLQVKLCV